MMIVLHYLYNMISKKAEGVIWTQVLQQMYLFSRILEINFYQKVMLKIYFSTEIEELKTTILLCTYNNVCNLS